MSQKNTPFLLEVIEQKRQTRTMSAQALKKDEHSQEEPLVIRIARAVFGCTNDTSRMRFASTSLEDDSYVWSKELTVPVDGAERYVMVEKRQETFCENTGDSIFSDRRRLDRREYRSHSPDLRQATSD